MLALILWPTASAIIETDDTGAGGAGPAGGGGGGMGGTGGLTSDPERLQYVVVAPTPVIIPPVEEKKPEIVPPPVPTPPEVVPIPDSVKTSVDIGSTVTGTGGGAGNDGSAGAGPGSGGGTGSGEGPGRGSSVGPGTGGGPGTVYPAMVTTLVMPPMPVPARVKPYEMVANFEVDTLGRSTLIYWTKSKDDAYNRRVEATLRGYRFRPAVTLTGIPVVDTVTIRAWAR